MVGGLYEQLQMDLASMQRYVEENDGYTHILVCIDMFSRQGFCRALRKKDGDETTRALKDVLSEIRYPVSRIQSDKGGEFFNKYSTPMMKEKHINHFATSGIDKAHMAERLIRTLRKRIHRYFAHKFTNRWVDILQTIVQNYNNTPHSSLPPGVTPNMVTLKNQKAVWKHLYWKKIKSNKVFEPPKQGPFKVGDSVRISKERNIFVKEADNTFSEEIFVIHKCMSGTPITYKLEDAMGEVLDGIFYVQELTPVVKPTEYMIEKVVRRRRANGREEVLVKWLDYPDKFNMWIPAANIKDLRP